MKKNKICFSIILIILLLVTHSIVYAAEVPTAFLYDGKDLVFQPNNTAVAGRTVTASWTNYNNGYTVNGSTSVGGGATLNSSSIPWHTYSSAIESITVQSNATITCDTAYWFYNFTKLSSVTMSNSISNIGEAAFYNTSSLKSITIPSSVGKIGIYAFHKSGLTSVSVEGTNSWTPSYPLAGSIGDYFDTAVAITKTSQLISSSAATTGGSSFAEYNRSASVETCTHTWIAATCTQPKYCSLCGLQDGDALGHDYSATYLYDDTQHWKKCSRCTSTTEVENHVDTDSNGYCDVCNYHMGTTSQPVTGQATVFLYNGKELVFQPNNTPASGKTVTASWSDFEYEVSGSISVANGASYDLNSSDIPWHDYSSAVESLVIQDGVTITCDTAYWFYKFTKLSSVTLGNGISNIGEAAFYNTSSLKSITIPANVGKIGIYAFHGSGLTSVSVEGTNSWTPSYPLAGSIGDYFDTAVAITKTSQLISSSAGTTGGSSFAEYNRATNVATCTHNWIAATCTQPRYCSLCGLQDGAALGHDLVAATCTDAQYCKRTGCNYVGDPALGHDYGTTYKYDDTQHWKKCSRCTSTTEYGNHVDTDLNGYCDTCNYHMYSAPTDPTITVKDNSGNVITTTWTNKDLKVSVGGSTIASGKGTVGYKYKMNNGTYSEYSSAVSYTSINTDTTFYAKAYNKDSTAYESGVVSRVLPKIEKTAPTLTLTMDSTNWAKAHTATLRFADTGGSGLKADTYTVEYAWTTSSSTPSVYTGQETVNITSGTTSKELTLTKNSGTGTYYLHIKINKNLTDVAGNTASDNTVYATCKLDNTAPVISLKDFEGNTVALNSSSVYTLGLLVKDEHSGISNSTFNGSDVDLKVNGNNSEAITEITYVSESNGVYEYSLKISNVKETGPITLEFTKSTLEDNVGNGVALEKVELTRKNGSNYTGVYADNINPVIMMMNELSNIKVDSGKNLNNYIDGRYINRFYTISIPFQVAEVGGQPLSTRLDPSIFTVNVGSALVTPTASISLDKTTITDDETGLTLYQEDYTLTLYGLLNDGYLEIALPAGIVTDLAGNANALNKSAPYINHDGTDVRVYVDNTKPQPTVKIASAVDVADSDAVITIEMFIRELGAGITSEQFKVEDMKFKIDGALLNNVNATMVENPGNNYDSALGSTVTTNYTYTLELSNLKENGILRIQITDNKIVDKANNGNISVTLDVDVIIDNEGPTLGILTSNANKDGEVYGDPIEVTISGCSDPSGIAQYEWQRSFDGVNFETIYIDNTSEADSTVDDIQTVEKVYYYRVIVKDTLGNSSISEVLPVIYKHSLNTKPTISLSKIQVTSDLAIINAIIKSKTPIVKILVNGSELPKSNYQNNVITNNYEITTTFEYQTVKNGVYTVEVFDEKGNRTEASINISTFDTTESSINVTKQDATFLTPAQIIFTSNEPIRIIDASAYPGITFDTSNFSTRVVATVPSDVSFNDSKTFIFENKGLIELPVEVQPPLITKFSYVRFAGTSYININMTIDQINGLIDNMAKAKVVTESGQIKSYYGLKNDNVDMRISTQSDITAAEHIGTTLETYYIDEKGEIVRLGRTMDSTVSNNSNYVNSNMSGMYQRTSGLLDSYSDTLLNDLTTEHTRFRMTIVP